MILKSIFEGYTEAKKTKRRQWQFQELEQYPLLFSSTYLNECYELASTKEEYESILGHLYRFSEVTLDVPSYRRLEKKIIDKYWRD